jgi:hypothetical protein
MDPGSFPFSSCMNPGWLWMSSNGGVDTKPMSLNRSLFRTRPLKHSIPPRVTCLPSSRTSVFWVTERVRNSYISGTSPRRFALGLIESVVTNYHELLSLPIRDLYANLSCPQITLMFTVFRALVLIKIPPLPPAPQNTPSPLSRFPSATPVLSSSYSSNSPPSSRRRVKSSFVSA